MILAASEQAKLIKIDILQFQTRFHHWRMLAHQIANQIKKFKRVGEKGNQDANLDVLVKGLQDISNIARKINDGMEDRLKNIQYQQGKIMQQLFQVERNRQLYKQTNRHNEQQKLARLSDKIANLQEHLHRTQENQRKLIEALSTLMSRHNVQEQPTIIQNDNYLNQRIGMIRNVRPEESFIGMVDEMAFQSPKISSSMAYNPNKNNNLFLSEVTHSSTSSSSAKLPIGPYSIAPSPMLFSNYSPPPPTQYLHTLSKNSLQTTQTVDNSEHRFKLMLQKLQQ